MPIQKILVVDDELAVRKLAQLSLEKLGRFRVVTAGSGPDAVAVAAREKPDVILLDLVMPEVDGPAALRLLRANPSTAGVPVIFLTAWSRFADVDAYLAMGAAGVIRKPFDPMQLPTLVRGCFADLVENRP